MDLGLPLVTKNTNDLDIVYNAFNTIFQTLGYPEKYIIRSNELNMCQ